MSFRRHNMIQVATLYAVLFSYYAELGLSEKEPYKTFFDELLSLIDFYVFGNSKKEIPILKDAIAEINNKMSDTLVNPNVVLNMLDVFIEDEKEFVKFGSKLRKLNKIQDILVTLPEYNPAIIEDLDNGNEYKIKLQSIIENFCKKAMHE